MLVQLGAEQSSDKVSELTSGVLEISHKNATYLALWDAPGGGVNALYTTHLLESSFQAC